MTDDTKPGTGLSNQWAAREERADLKRILDAPRKFGNKGKDKTEPAKTEAAE